MPFAELPRTLLRALTQLSDPRVLGILATSVLLMLLVTAPFAAVFLAIAWVIEAVTPASVTLPWLGEMSFLGVLTQGLFSKASWVFWTYVMAPVAGGIMGLFLENVVAAVERRHYPALAPVRPRSIAASLFYALRFFGLMALVSLAALIVSLFSGPLAPVVFVAANGYLIAREYFETVALRRIDEARAKQLERANITGLWLLGCVLALAYTVPFVSLLVPITGVAAYTHVFHRLNASPGSAPATEHQ